MSDLVRMTISLEEPLYRQLEKLVKESNYTNRSEFVRDMVREQLVARQWDDGDETLGTITLVYNHHQRRLGEKLTDIQHDHHDLVLAATHVHLSHDLCAEVIIVRGRARQIQHLADALKREKGVLHATLSMSTTGHKLA